MWYHKFNYWVKKIHRENIATSAPTRGFSQIPVQQPDLTEQNQQALAAITFPSGARIELFGSLNASFTKCNVGFCSPQKTVSACKLSR